MRFNKIRSKLAEDFEIPDSVMSRNFNMWIQGNKKVIIENHLGVTAYEDDIVGIKTKEQNLTIIGQNFKIDEINEYKIIIAGLIKEIKIQNKE